VSRRRVLITGLTGQDGGYLAEQLLAAGDEVTGTAQSADGALEAKDLAHLEGHVRLLEADLLDPDSIHRAVREAKPEEIYHLAAPTHVPTARKDPEGTRAAIVGGTEAVLAAAGALGDEARVLVAASSEVFGDSGASPQTEDTPTRPRNAYGEAKLAAHRLVGELRAGDGRFLVSAIAYNHESPRRPEHFVSRSISSGVAAIAAGRAERLGLGNQRSIRDWSHARDVVAGMVLALRHDTPDDYILASGVGRTVGALVDLAFSVAGVERRLPDGRDRVFTEPSYWRPEESRPLVGDPTKARTTLGWEPQTTFEQLVAEMVEADLARLGVASR
jgi:GDPmannose 4,6-dehydratase